MPDLESLLAVHGLIQATMHNLKNSVKRPSLGSVMDPPTLGDKTKRRKRLLISQQTVETIIYVFGGLEY